MRPILRIFVKAVKPGGSSEPNFCFVFEEFLSNFCPSSLVLATHNLVCARPGCRVPLGRACSIPSFLAPCEVMRFPCPLSTFVEIRLSCRGIKVFLHRYCPFSTFYFPCPSTQLVVAMGVF